jgi:ribosomal protein S18 acetylase RimI-like enzyme
MYVIRPALKRELRTALLTLLSRPGVGAEELEGQVEALLRYTRRQGLSVDECMMALEADSVKASCLCVDAPGRTASVFVPADIGDEDRQRAVVSMLVALCDRAGQRGIRLVQGLVAPESGLESALYRRAGFERLTELIYLEREVNRPLSIAPPPGRVAWTRYDPRTHEQFARVIQATYAGSLDCPRLNGIRDIEDVLASHRAVGVFDPRCWLLAHGPNGPLGALLLARIRERDAMEVVYMGLLPDQRGCGYGMAMLRQAAQLARDRAVAHLTLSVDAGNAPARRLYDTFGFRETTRREVWIRAMAGSGGSD